MGCSCLIATTLESNKIRSLLFQNSTEKDLVRDLQKTLYELGFGKELNWQRNQADGLYGPATAAAVAAFAIKNKLASDGQIVTKELAKVLMQRHGFLPELYVLWEIHSSDLRTKRFISKATRTGIGAMQVLLNFLGYGEQLNFVKYGADGKYGPGTRNALITYASDNGIVSDGDLLTRPFLNLLLKDINAMYGADWSDLAEQNMPARNSPLILYSGSRFMGKPCIADKEFEPMLERINLFAEAANVFVYVNSAFRTTTVVNGAIVTPSQVSNHLAGHAIDMNVIYNDSQWANSKVLSQFPNVPDPVKNFIQSINDDKYLRWGGNFRNSDPVHIDDHLNKDMSKWNKRYAAMQSAVQFGVLQ